MYTKLYLVQSTWSNVNIIVLIGMKQMYTKLYLVQSTYYSSYWDGVMSIL